MFEIKSPKKFLRQLIIVEFLLGVILIFIGFYFLIRLIIRVFIIQGYYRDPIQWSIILILFIACGILGFLSFITMKKSKKIGIDIGMVSFVLLALNALFISLYIFITDLLRQLTGGHFIIASTQFGLLVILSLFSIYMFLTIFQNRENLKNTFKYN